MSASTPGPDLPEREADRLRALLGDADRWPEVRVVGSTGSTNADLATAARAGRAPAGAVLLSWHQSTGRGRLDRSWSAPPGTSAALSVLLDLTGVPAARVPWLSLTAGLAVAAGVRRTTGLAPQLKWPNDVQLDGRKICGILAERVETPTGPGAVLGLGLNLTQTAEQLPVPTATSLALAGAPDLDRLVLVAGVLTGLAERVDRWRAGSPELRREYRERCATLGRDVVVHLPDGTGPTGRAVDVDAAGRLVVEHDGVRQAHSAGDVVHLR